MAGANFGCGSSREHAPWALLDFGIHCVIAPSFADIFYNNSFKNGILLITLPQADIDRLLEDASKGANAVLTIDLELANKSRGRMAKRWPSILSLSQALPAQRPGRYRPDLQKQDKIATYETERRVSQPWL